MNRIFTALAAALLLSSCGTATPARPPLEGAAIGGPFSLTDQNGRTVKDSDFAGKYRMIYFGYTTCPDVCPTDMARIAAVLRSLDKSDPALAAKLAPIFITIDPERDDVAALKQFAAAFDNRIVALTGTPQAIAAVAKAYGVPVAKGAVNAEGGYLMDHGTLTYLMGPDGKPIAYFSHDMSVAQVIDELKKWVT